MARNSTASGWLNRRVTIPVKWILSAIILLPVLFMYGLIASNPDDNVALTRNEVVNAAGGRTWFGRFSGSSKHPYREVAATIRFLDSNGQPVGEVSAQDDLLEAGEALDLQAPLPPGAVMMQMYSLQWRAGTEGGRVIGELLGPYLPWDFGYLQRDTSQ